MSEIWVVFGATGQQGGAVARAVLQDTTISVRAATRNLSSPAAATLRDLGCELVRADLDDRTSLNTALKGASGVFLVTTNDVDEKYYEREFAQGKNAADAAVEAGVQKMISSTLQSVKNATNGNLTKVVHFDVKYDIEQYIRKMPIASTFIALGAFMSNFATFLRPQDVGDGTFAIKSSMPGSTLLPLVDATDVGRAVARMVKGFDRYRDRTINLAAELQSLDEVAAAIGRVNSKAVKYVQISPGEFLAPLSRHKAEDWAEFAVFMSDYGYFGEETRAAPTDELGELTRFENYVKEGIVLGSK
ncbi:hypothetical protein M409DRAFT_28512 [Zasmidium cellare ATCC 36951]|uniref:NmrA-like domain-containing protein n=1 Tax=Zasmidium cellare ATCC 36951 TaxID=1080233 RepID=A0A6A6C269_ZASCE|nr:uncharacterized protein M409DRAFT_28512 [Zasmidium cellare ATCC 36951]KAF2161184.1 hypothetical protein M409DRAFT_28512 [Zasmidium cellare ATCC 36951]